MGGSCFDEWKKQGPCLSSFGFLETTKYGLPNKKSIKVRRQKEEMVGKEECSKQECYLTELGSPCPVCSKAHLLTLGCDGGKYSVYCRRQARKTGSSCSEDLKSPVTFREVFLRTVWEIRDQLMHSSPAGWWWGNKVMFQGSQSSTFWFQTVWGLHTGSQHAVNFFHLMGV